MPRESPDVVVIGAGAAGIVAAWRAAILGAVRQQDRRGQAQDDNIDAVHAIYSTRNGAAGSARASGEPGVVANDEVRTRAIERKGFICPAVFGLLLLKSDHCVRPAFDVHRVDKANVLRLAGHYQ